MAAFGRSSVFVVCIAVFSTLLLQNMHHDAMLEGIPSGKTRVLDLSYAINDKLVPWPGDGKFFEAKVNATIEKNGYFTRSFWMLEHYGTHLDAPAHFPPGKTTVDQIPVKQLFGPAVVIDVRAESGKDPDYQLGTARVEDWGPGQDAFSGVHSRRGEAAGGAESERAGLRYAQYRLRCFRGFRGASHFVGSGFVSS